MTSTTTMAPGSVTGPRGAARRDDGPVDQRGDRSDQHGDRPDEHDDRPDQRSDRSGDRRDVRPGEQHDHRPGALPEPVSLMSDPGGTGRFGRFGGRYVPEA